MKRLTILCATLTVALVASVPVAPDICRQASLTSCQSACAQQQSGAKVLAAACHRGVCLCFLNDLEFEVANDSRCETAQTTCKATCITSMDSERDTGYDSEGASNPGQGPQSWGGHENRPDQAPQSWGGPANRGYDNTNQFTDAGHIMNDQSRTEPSTIMSDATGPSNMYDNNQDNGWSDNQDKGSSDNQYKGLSDNQDKGSSGKKQNDMMDEEDRPGNMNDGFPGDVMQSRKGGVCQMSKCVCFEYFEIENRRHRHHHHRLHGLNATLSPGLPENNLY